MVREKYFQAWLSRPSHIEEHSMRKAEKENTSSIHNKKIKQLNY